MKRQLFAGSAALLLTASTVSAQSAPTPEQVYHSNCTGGGKASTDACRQLETAIADRNARQATISMGGPQAIEALKTQLAAMESGYEQACVKSHAGGDNCAALLKGIEDTRRDIAARAAGLTAPKASSASARQLPSADGNADTPAQQAKINRDFYRRLITGANGKPIEWFSRGKNVAVLTRYSRTPDGVRIDTKTVNRNGDVTERTATNRFDDATGVLVWSDANGSARVRYRREGEGAFRYEMVSSPAHPNGPAVPGALYRFIGSTYTWTKQGASEGTTWDSVGASEKFAIAQAEIKAEAVATQAKIARWGLAGRMMGKKWSWYRAGSQPTPYRSFEWVVPGESARVVEDPSLGGKVAEQWRWNDQLNRIDLYVGEQVAAHITPDASGGYTLVNSDGTYTTSPQQDGSLVMSGTSNSGASYFAYVYDMSENGYALLSEASQREVAAQVERDQAAYDEKRAAESESFDRFMGAVNTVQSGLSAAEAEYDAGAGQRQAELDAIQAQTDAIIAQRQQDGALPQAYGSAAVQNAQDAAARQQQIADENEARREAQSNARNPALVIEKRPEETTKPAAPRVDESVGKKAQQDAQGMGFLGKTCAEARAGAQQFYGKNATFTVIAEYPDDAYSSGCRIVIDMDSVKGRSGGASSQ